uniref:Uncharacterized protein n=1 Tax=Monopterus albus TaxID=43700 RepID=A0A3Q3IH99_MONAL
LTSGNANTIVKKGPLGPNWVSIPVVWGQLKHAQTPDSLKLAVQCWPIHLTQPPTWLGQVQCSIG